MKIYTSYFGNVDKLPKDITPIAICGKRPEWWKGLHYSKLAPKLSFFLVWKQTQDNDYYIKHFKEEVLDRLDVKKVLDDLANLSNCEDVALICYETPEKFCHRHLVADWLIKNGYNCEEI